MKTLPAAITSGKSGGSEPIILVRVLPESGDTWFSSLGFNWATDSVLITDYEGGADKIFVDEFLAKDKLPLIRHSVGIQKTGTVGHINSLKLTIVNPDYGGGGDRFDEKVDTYNFENRKVEIRLAYATGSSIPYANTLLLYWGTVKNTTYDYAYFTFEVEPSYIKKHKNIPGTILTRKASTIYAALPEYNIGKVIPLCFGQLWGDVVSTGGFKAVPLLRISEGNESFILSGNKMAEIGVAIHKYFSDCNGWQKIYPKDLDEYDYTYTWARPSRVQLMNALTGVKDWYGDFYNYCTHQGSQTLPAGISLLNVIDANDLTNYVQLNENDRLYLKVNLPRDLGKIWNAGSSYLKLQIGFSSASGDPCGVIKYYNPDTGTFSTGINFGSGDSSPKFYNFGSDTSAHSGDWTVQAISDYEWGVTVNAGCSVRIHFIYMMILKTLVRYMGAHSTIRRGMQVVPEWYRNEDERNRGFDLIQSAENLCGEIQGVRFGAWIDEGGRDNVFNEDDIPDTGVFHIESILRDELGLDTDDIDVESFDAVGGASGRPRGLWAFANVITRSRNSLRVIEGFCQNACIIYFTNYENKEKVVSLTKKASADKTIDRSTIQKKTVKVYLSPLNQVYNQFKIKHNKQWVTDNFLEVSELDESTTNLPSNTRSGTPNTYTGLCADSQDKYKFARLFEFDAEWSPDGGVASGWRHILKWFAEWLCYRKWIVEFESHGTDHLELELGDQIKIDHTLLPDSVSNTAFFMIIDVQHNLNKDRMKFKCIQIPDLLP